MTSLKRSFLFRRHLQLQSDSFVVWALRVLAGITSAIAVIIGVFLIKESIPAFVDVGIVAFFFDKFWHPTGGAFGMLPMLLGTLLSTVGAVMIAAPLGLVFGIFIHFYIPGNLKNFYRRFVEILAGIPSVVYGFWGLMFIVPVINEFEAPGASLLAAILVLAIMIFPTMALSADAAITSVPKSLIQAAEALGLDRAGIISTAVIPAAKSSLFSGMVLSTGRAIGETMAVLMVCGNIVQVPASFFDPIRTLTANIALEMSYAVGTHRSSLFVSGLFLLLLIIALVTIAETVNKRGKHVS